MSTDTNICTDGKPLPYHHRRPPENDQSKCLSAILEEDKEGVDMPQATIAATLVSQPPLKKPRIRGAGSSGESVQQKAKEVVARSCSELAQQRDSGNSAPIAQLPLDDEDTETLSHRKKRKSAEALACSTLDLGQQDLSSLGRVTMKTKKKLSKDVVMSLPPSSASPANEVSGSAIREADLTIPHPEEMPDDECVPLSPPQAASSSPTPQSEPHPLQSSPVCHASPTLSTSIVPESIEMMHEPCRPLPHDNLGSSQQSDGFATDSVEVEGEVHEKKVEKEPGMLSVQMKDAESKLLWEIDDEKERVMVEWEKVKEATTSFMTRLPEIALSFKRASELIVKLKQENKDLEVKLKQENEVARAYEKKASDLSKELDIVRADRDSLSRRFQDAKKKAADLCDAFDAIRAACDGVAVVSERLGSFPTELTDEAAAAADRGHCRIGMQ